MHKPTLLKVLKFAKDFAPEDPQVGRELIEHILARATAEDSSLNRDKLLAGAGITL